MIKRISVSRLVYWLAGVCALAFLPPTVAVVFGAWPFDGDALAAFGPWHEFAAQSLRSGVLPLWNPHLYCGTPFMANGQSGVLYPPNVVYLFLPVRAALVTDAWLHDVLLACGGYALARALRLGRLGAWVVAVCLALGGAVSAHIYAGHLTWNAARAYTPWELWALLLYLRGGRKRYLWGLAPLATLQLAAGSPPVSVLGIELCCGLLFAWVASSFFSRRGSGLPAGWWWQLPACAGLAGLLAGAIALPVAEFSRLSVHGAGMQYDDVVALSGTWRSLVRLISPDFFGGNGTAPQWSLPFSPHEEEAYIGVFGVWLALAAPWLARSTGQGVEGPRPVGWLWALLPVSALLAMGGNTSLYRPLFEHLAVFRVTRAPVRWFELWYFAAALLAGFSFDACFARRRETGDADSRLKWLIAALCVTAGVAILAAVVAFALPASSHPWQSAIHLFHGRDSVTEQASIGERFRTKAATAAFTTGIVALLAASMVGQWLAAPTAGERRRIELKMAGLITLDLLFASISSMLIVSGGDYARQLQWPAALVARYHPGDRWDTQVEDEREMDQGMPLGVDLYNGYDPLNSSRYFEFVHAMEPDRSWGGVYQPWDRTPLLLTTGTGYTLAAPHLDGSLTHSPPGELRPEEIATANKWTLWSYEGAWPRAYLTRNLKAAPDSHQLELLDRVAQSPFRVPGDAGGPAVVAPGVFAVRPTAMEAREGIALQRPSVNEVQLDASASAPSVAVLTESYFPGWQAWVNAAPAQPGTANFLFRAAGIPSGHSQIDWVYNSSTFRFGMFLSLVGIAVWCGAWWGMRGNP